MGENSKNRRSTRQADYDDSRTQLAVAKNCNIHAEDLVPTFCGTDKTFSVARWAQEIDDHAEIFQWTPLQTLIVARRSLTGTAALWLRSERAYKSWDELKGGLSKEFPDVVDSKTIHEMVAQRKKSKDESCIDYLLTMKEMGKRGKMPDYVAIRYIIDGIVDDEINKMVLYGATTYTELKEKIKIYETITNKITRREPRPEPTMKRRGIRCYSCGELDHQSSHCPNKEKGLKCFKCNNFGHIASQCNSASAKETTNDRARRRVDFLKIDESAEDDRTKPNLTMCASHFTADVSNHDVDSSLCHTMNNMAEPITSGETDGCDKMAELSMTDDANFTFVYNEHRIPVQKNNDKNAYKTIRVNECETKALIDSGSSVNIISSDLYTRLGSPEFRETSGNFTGLGCSKVTSTKTTNTTVNLDGHDYNVMFYVIIRDAMPCDVILGQDFLQHVAIMSKGSVMIVPSINEWLCSLSCCVCPDEYVLGNIKNEEVRSKVIDCVENYKPIQTKDAPLKLRIVLKDDIPVAQRPRRLSLAEQSIVEKQVTEWLNDGIIRAWERFKDVLAVASQYGLQINWKKSRLICRRIEYRKTYNQNRKKSREYVDGNFVAIRRIQFGTGLKLKPKDLDPYRVTKVKRNDRYDVEKVDHRTEGSRITSSAADYMKPWPMTSSVLELGE